MLLACENPEKIAEMYRLAEEIKLARLLRQPHRYVCAALSVQLLYQRLRLLPVSRKNRHIARKKLTQDEVRAEVIALQDLGHKRLAIEAGEDPKNNRLGRAFSNNLDTITAQARNGAIRRDANVIIAATTVDEYRMLRNAGYRHSHPVQERCQVTTIDLHPTD